MCKGCPRTPVNHLSGLYTVSVRLSAPLKRPSPDHAATADPCGDRADESSAGGETCWSVLAQNRRV